MKENHETFVKYLFIFFRPKVVYNIFTKKSAIINSSQEIILPQLRYRLTDGQIELKALILIKRRHFYKNQINKLFWVLLQSRKEALKIFFFHFNVVIHTVGFPLKCLSSTKNP